MAAGSLAPPLLCRRLAVLIIEWTDPGRIERASLRAGLWAARSYARGVLLDVGANRSPHAALFRDRVDRYLGCDLQPAASPYLRIVGAAEHLPIVDASIDTVLCTQVLDDLPEPAALFEEVHRVLAPGGHLILTAPFFWRQERKAAGSAFPIPAS